MWRFVVCVCFLVLTLAQPALGQPITSKPIGMFGLDDDAPAWATFGPILDVAPDDQIIAARVKSEQTGFKWVLLFGYNDWGHVRGADPEIYLVKERLERLGLWPHIAVILYREEWYEWHGANEFEKYGVPRWTTAEEYKVGVKIIHAWLGEQHRIIKLATGKPVGFLGMIVNNDERAWGPFYYRPVPANTDLVFVDAYINQTCGGTYAQCVAPVYAQAEKTVTQPLVMVPGWFEIDGDPLYAQPTLEDWLAPLDHFLTSPKWVAMMSYLWSNQGSGGVRGLKELPDLYREVGRTLFGDRAPWGPVSQ